MDKIDIEYNGKPYIGYNVDQSDVFEGDESCNLLIAPESLWDDIKEDAIDKNIESAVELDNTIFFYCPDALKNDNPIYEVLVGYIKEQLAGEFDSDNWKEKEEKKCNEEEELKELQEKYIKPQIKVENANSVEMICGSSCGFDPDAMP